ncbi:MAG TPA: hypothetical protein ENJ22_03760 [Gammaproteobacteria bacterium]|nr:hypothetical protein [Gammaproteobacteria bacterium]
MPFPETRKYLPVFSFLFFVILVQTLFPSTAEAIPAFARKYSLSCVTCHAAFPRLNEFGQHFSDSNLRLPNWREGTVDTGDERLALPSYAPFAIRAQAYGQARKGKSIDPVSGATEQASTDFQTPYLVKFLASAPLSDHISYYFYGIFAEKGGNGEVIIEDAWFQHDDLFGSGISMQMGQFQISDLMFARETRLTFQDYMVYRMAGITYDRGVMFGRDLGSVDLGLGIVNGNGIEENFNINSPGYHRPDKMFDNNSNKSVFGRIGTRIGPASVGLFGLAGEQANAIDPAGMESGNRDTDKRVVGIDASGIIHGKTYWFAQALWNTWDGFLDESRKYEWWGGFVGADYIASDRWVFSTLYNYADANDLNDTDTIYEGIDINSLSLTASYYFMRNVKGITEINIDFLDEEDQKGSYYTGHLTKEDYILFGFDAAF